MRHAVAPRGGEAGPGGGATHGGREAVTASRPLAYTPRTAMSGVSVRVAEVDATMEALRTQRT